MIWRNDHPRNQRPTRVLVVDDSAVARQVLSSILTRAGGFDVVVAADPIVATASMARERPDVMVLDLEMPRMDGLTFLRQIMAEAPLPVIVCSGNAAPSTDAALEALELGALEIVAKPKLGHYDRLDASAVELLSAIRALAGSRRPARRAPAAQPQETKASTQERASRGVKLVAIGTSTGGPEALRAVLAALPEDAPPLVVVQHMPAGYIGPFAQRLDKAARISVKEAEAGDVVTRGRALIAPGGRHLTIQRRGSAFVVALSDGPRVGGHRPSVDMLFRSVADAAGADAAGVIMTGMGDDGVDGLLAMRSAGALTLAQDEATSVVFGMPKEAIARGAVDHVVPLGRIASIIQRM